jgi:predicted GNAT family acetyltransferase
VKKINVRPVYRDMAKAGKSTRLDAFGWPPQAATQACWRKMPVLCIAGLVSLHGKSTCPAESQSTMSAVRDNQIQGRFELDVEGQIAFASYRRTPAAVIITHTETPRTLRGRGIASELVKGALELIRADGNKVIAGCSFVVDYLRNHPEDADIVA